MDRLRTLLLARSHVVVMDPDLAASATTAPSRAVDVEKLEDELVQLGFVLSLDLALTLRRLPKQAVQKFRSWIYETLARDLGVHRPHVPLHGALTSTAPGDTASGETASVYLRRIVSWLSTMPEQPCPWCGEIKNDVGALDPCGHLVCRTCWGRGSHAGCPICHRRVALGDPFVKAPTDVERITKHTGSLTLLHLGFDLIAIAKARFARLLSRTTSLSPIDRDEIEAVIDTVGPKAVTWLPARIPVRETMAIVIARLWLVSPDRSVMVGATADHVQTATDVLQIALVLMGANPLIEEPIRLSSVGRSTRRAILAALERLPPGEVIEDMMRHRQLWKRAGERLHPFELADALPNVAVAFAAVRRSKLSSLTFGATVRERAVQMPFVYVEDEVIKSIAWAGPIEDALRAGNPRSALARLTHRPGELIRRADHLVRTAQMRQLDALQTVLKSVELAAIKGPAGPLLKLASHVSRRARPWPRRVFFPKGEVLRAWNMRDKRTPLRGDAIAVMVGTIRRHLVARAEACRQFPRAVIDRALVDLLLPTNERPLSRSRLEWSRGSEIAVPDGQKMRLFIHWEDPIHQRVDLDLSVALFDEAWRHVATCDLTNLNVADHAAVHSGDLASAAPPLGASEYVDLHLEQLAMLGVRHAVMVVFSYDAVPFDHLTHGFAGVVLAPTDEASFDPRGVKQRFDLRGRSKITIPFTIDLGDRRLRWLDVHLMDRGEIQLVGGHRAAFAHIGRDFGDLIATHSRPTLWDVACIHAAARANTIYIRERDGSFTMYRRHDGEKTVARLGRVMSGATDDGRMPAIPPVDAPTWFALMMGMTMPNGSMGYVLDARGLPSEGIERLTAAELVAELQPIGPHIAVASPDAVR